MQQQKGFTLIELIIVIVILGILAVTAAPKFIDIQKDAKGGTVKSVEGAVNSISSIVYGKALIAGQTAASGQTVNVNGTARAVSYGYLDASVDLRLLLDIDSEMKAEFAAGATTGTLAAGAAAGNPGALRSAITFYETGAAAAFDFSTLTSTNMDTVGCLILYTQSTGANVPATVTAYTGDCN